MKEGNRSHSNTYNVAMGFILKGTQLIFPFITFPYASRILSVEGIGQVSFVQSITNIFSLLAMLGIPLYGIRACAKYRDDKEQLSKTAIEIIIINLISVVISFILLFVFCFLSQRIHSNLNIVMVFSFSILLTFAGVEWLYQAIEDYTYITIRGIIGKFLAAAYLFAFVRDSSDIVHYAVCIVIGTVGTNLANLIRLKKIVSAKQIKGKLNLRQHVAPIMSMFLFTAISQIYTSLDSTMLGYMTNDYQVGLYSAASKIKAMLIGIIGSISSVLLSRTSYLIEQKRKEEVTKLMTNTMSFTLFLAIPCAFFCFAIARPAILLLSGESFIPAAAVLKVLVPSIILISITNVIGVQYYVASGKEKHLVVSNSLGAITDVILNIFFITRYGAAGAAFATVIAELLVTSSLIMQESKIVKHFFDLPEIIKLFLACIICTIIIQCIPILNNTLLYVILCGMIFSISYFIILILIKEKFIHISISLLINHMQ